MDAASFIELQEQEKANREASVAARRVANQSHAAAAAAAALNWGGSMSGSSSPRGRESPNPSHRIFHDGVDASKKSSLDAASVDLKKAAERAASSGSLGLLTQPERGLLLAIAAAQEQGSGKLEELANPKRFSYQDQRMEAQLGVRLGMLDAWPAPSR